MTEFTDEYFLNLTMDYDKRDDEIYPKWAVWCAKSDDKYYIDGKDGHFYTYVRSEEEIAIERKRREIMEFSMEQRFEAKDDESFREYDMYIHDLIRDDKTILDVKPLTFKEWKEKHAN